jgi:shikimate dehydrogenase
LHDAVPTWKATAGPAAILGAGGAARAVVAALADVGVTEIRIVNRTLARAEVVANDLAVPKTRITIHSWEEVGAALRDAGLLVNATSLGMAGEPALTLDLSSLPPSTPVIDIVYVPLETDLLATARRRGHPVVDGLGMLLHQGRPGFEAWFGAPVQVTHELRAAILATLAPAR